MGDGRLFSLGISEKEHNKKGDEQAYREKDGMPKKQKKQSQTGADSNEGKAFFCYGKSIVYPGLVQFKCSPEEG